MKKVLLVLCLSTPLFVQAQSDSTQANKSTLRNWLDRRNERLDQLKREETFEEQQKASKRTQRIEKEQGVVNLQEPITQAKRNAYRIQDAGYALKSGGGLILGGLGVAIAGAGIGAVLNSDGKNGNGVVVGAAAVGLLLNIIGCGQIIRSGRILTDYED